MNTVLMIFKMLNRIFSGVGSGLCPMYLTEIAPIAMRGAFGALYQFGLAAGFLTSQV